MAGDVFTSHADLASRQGWTREECGGILRILERDDGWATAACDQCPLEVAVPIRDLDPTIQTAHLLTRAEFPSRFVGKEFVRSGDTAWVCDQLGVWAQNEKLTPTPVLWGRPGRGKTHLVVVTVRELVMRRQVRTWFRTAPALISELQTAIGSPRYDEIWQQAVTVDLLLLDDLGAEMDTDWRADRIAALIDARYRADLPVMATTNIAPARWPDAFDARTASRLQEMSTPYELLGVDRRSSAPAPQPRESSGTVVHEGLIHVGVQEA